MKQQAIIEHDLGRHARVLAGPGTGKSATVIRMMLRAAEQLGRRGKLLTFTRAATNELRESPPHHVGARTSLRPTRDASGVDVASLHRLRHSVATYLVGNGHLLKAQARLGHREASTTLRTYAHTLPLDDADVADAMETLLAGADP